MDSLTWLREYRPSADDTLRAEGDTDPLTENLRRCADSLSTALGKLQGSLKALGEMSDALLKCEGRLDSTLAHLAKMSEDYLAASHRLGEIKKALAEALDDYEKTGYVAAVRHVMDTIEAPVVEKCAHYFPPAAILQQCEKCGALKDETGVVERQEKNS